MRKVALEKLEEIKPLLLVVAPPCNQVGSIQGFDAPKMSEGKASAMQKESMIYVAFAAALCKHQANASRKLILEHLARASSWKRLAWEAIRLENFW